VDASTFASGCLLELLRARQEDKQQKESGDHCKEVKSLGNLKPGSVIKGPNNLTIRIEVTKDQRIGKYNKNGLTKKGERMMRAYYEEWLREQEFRKARKQAHEKLSEYLSETDKEKENVREQEEEAMDEV